MLKEILVLTLLLSQAMPLFSPHSDYVSVLPHNQLVSVTIVERPNNLALLQMYVQEHKVLNESQMEQLFIPRDKISSVTSYLSKFGIYTTSYLNVIEATGTVGQFERALGGEFVVIKFHDKTFYEYQGVTSPLVSNSLVFSSNVTQALLERPVTLYNITQAVAFSQVTPKQLQKVYNVTPLLSRGVNGTNVTIGILDFYGDPYIQQQLKDFDSIYNLSNPPFFQVQSIGAYNPNDGITTGWALEISLDVEYAHILAPGAGIILYVANPNVSLPAAIAYVDKQDRVSVLSQSFGIPEIYVALGLVPLSMIQSLTYEYWLGEVEGITFVASSGDAGGNGYNFFLSPLGDLILPASDPYVLSVGGTSVYYTDQGSVQSAWSGESVYGATTGGFSVIFPSPWYQGLEGQRMVPDVVADGNPFTGVPVLYYYNNTYLVGGTSLSSPLVSSIIALADQVHGRLGFVNPLIYKLNGTKALVPVTYGYNTPYVAEGVPNPVTGLGYINAGYFVKMITRSGGLSVAVDNTTYLDGQTVRVIVNATGQGPLTAFIFNGTKGEQINLVFNGTYWIGEFKASGSGVQEVVVQQGTQEAGAYFTVGLQGLFLLPQVAIYPEPGNLPVLVHLTYPNGSVATSSAQFRAVLYSYDPVTNSQKEVSSVVLSHPLTLNFTRYGVQISNASNYVFGSFNFNSSMVGGIYVVRVPGVFGFDEFVGGIYVVPYVVPGVATEPVVVTPGQNFTLVVFAETLGSPNVTVEFVSNNRSVFNTTVNSVETNFGQFYVLEMSLPSSVPPGYYYLVARASYNFTNYTATGVGVAQIYVAPSSLRVSLLGLQETALQNSTYTVNAEITYSNGTPVKYGTLTAFLIPSYLQDSFDTLSIGFSVPMEYVNGTWVGNFTLPSGTTANSLGLSPYALSGEWQIYLDGVSYDGIPTNTSSVLDYVTLNVVPRPLASFTLMPYVYTPFFNGTSGYNLYVVNARIIGHNATLVNSVVYNLTVINATVSLVNTQVFHYSIVNGSILNNTAITPSQILTTSNEVQHTPSPTSQVQSNQSNVYVSIAILIVGLMVALYIWVSERRKG